MARVPQATLLTALTFSSLGCGRTPLPQCGVASLVNVLARAGRPISYRALLRRTRVVDGHTTFADLAFTAHGYGIVMKGYRLDDPKLAPNDLGVIELTADHFVALVGHEGERYKIVDSPDGGRHESVDWSAARLGSEWTGNVLLVERTPKGSRRGG